MERINDAVTEYWAALKAEMANAPVVKAAPTVEADVCPICFGRGWFTADVRYDDARFGKPQRCTNPQCKAANEVADRALKNYELPKSYRKLTFAGWKSLPDALKKGKYAAYHAALAFAKHPQHLVNLRAVCENKLPGWEALSDDERNSLVFHGPMGMGKTGFCASIMNYLSGRGYAGILYRRASDMLQDLQDAFEDKDKASEARELSFAQRLGRYKNATILILDEWNVEKRSEFRLQCMEDVIRFRHGHELPTLITTNLTKDESYTHWSERTADVLAEMAHWVPVGGTKLRKG